MSTPTAGDGKRGAKSCTFISEDGVQCATRAQSGGLCRKHGTFRCKAADCDKYDAFRGYCILHARAALGDEIVDEHMKAKTTARCRSAVSNGNDENVCLQNYKKSGTPFVNQFFIAALREAGKGHNNILYHLGVQHEVDSIKPGQFPENAGWVYSFGSRTGEPNTRVRTPSRG